ncbi:MAG: PAS domain S-box protein, partial [Proteobacteria bacterium]|nr:PAS domain S-box protein [Pseudomonadota bacterium]
IHPDDRERVMGIIGGALEDYKAGKDSKRTIVQRLLRLDGTEFWGESTGVVFTYKGEPAIQTVIRDITERKRTEEDLQEEKERFRGLVEATSDWVWVVDKSSVYTYASPKVREVLGYEVEEVLGKTPFDFMESEEAERVRGIFEPIAEERKSFRYLQNNNRAKDGSTIVLETSGVPVFDSSGSFRGYSGIDRDITKRKRDEEELRRLKESLEKKVELRTKKLKEAEEKFRTIFESSSDALSIIGESGVIDFNDAAMQMMGYTSREGLLGTNPDDWSPPTQPDGRDSVEAAAAEIAIAFKEGRNIFEWTHRRADGELFPAEVLLTPMQLDGAVVLQTTVRDITERKRAEEEIARNYHIQRVISSILQTSLEEIPLNKMLEQALDSILSVPLFSMLRKGAIFLVEGSGDSLKLEVQYGLSGSLLKMCDSLPFGRCLCGRAASGRTTVFAERISDEHDNRYEGMTPHGHYCVPILLGDEVLGVINIYVPEGHKRVDEEEQFFTMAANTLAGIIERKRAEKALQASETNLVKAQEVAHIGSWYLDLVENNLVWSAENHRIFGVPEGIPMTYEGFIEVVHPEDRAYVGKEWSAAVDGKPYDIEHRLLIDNEVKWVREKAELNRDDSGAPISAIGITQDITERKRAEEALKESEERWQQIADNSNDFIMIINTQSVIQYINRLMPGLTMEQVVGTPITDWVPEDSKSTIASCVEGVLRTGEIGWYETEYVGSDGTVSKFESRVGPISTNGKITELVVSAGDVTKRYNAEKEKEALYAQLLQAQKMEAIGTLAGGIAHDFNNILTVVKSLSSLALSKVPDDSPIKEYFEPIQYASERGTSLIQQLMIFSESRPPEVVELDINESIGELLGMLRALIDVDISIEEVLGEGIWTVEGDRGRLEQVVTNLILNASDALVQGGQIEISTENVTVTEESAKSIGDVAPGKYVRLSVEDDGVGMAPEVVAHIFEPFFTTKSPAGTGLGLSVVYGIIKEMHGSIEVSSVPGLGAKFSVYLPVTDLSMETLVTAKEAGAPYNQGAPDASVPVGAGETVLLVEDDEWVRRSTALALRENGYTVTEAADAKSATRLFESAKGRFGLILSDVVMPGRDGLQMVDELLQVVPGVPVLFYSGHIGDKAQLDSILKRGFAFLQKPYEVPDLLKAVKECIEEA